MAKLSRRRFLAHALALSGTCALAGAARAAQQPPSTPLYPVDTCQGPNGTLYITDSRLHAVWRLNEGRYELLYQGSDRYRTPLYRAWDIAPVGSEQLVISDPATMDIWLLSTNGRLRPFTAELIRPEEDKDLPLKEQRFAGLLDKPMALTTDSEGRIYVADLGLNAVYRIRKPGDKLEQIGSVRAPRGITLDHDGTLVVVSHSKQQLVRLHPDGKTEPIVDGAIAPSDVISFPHQVILWDQDHYLVSDGYARTLWLVGRDGKVEPLTQGDPLRNPVGLWRSGERTAYVADPHARKVFRVQSDGTLAVAGV